MPNSDVNKKAYPHHFWVYAIGRRSGFSSAKNAGFRHEKEVLGEHLS
jgi:hypothetical protein